MKRKEPGYPLEPRHLTDATWFYETKDGLEIVHRVHSDVGAFIQTDTIILPWRKLSSAVDRHRKVKAGRP
jgi:hypothetical protein